MDLVRRMNITSLFSGDSRSKEEIDLVNKLSAETKLPASEVETLRKKFLLCADAKTQSIDKLRFRNLLKYYFKHESVNWDPFFRVFDFDASGHISFEEFVRSLAVLLQGPPDKQLDLLFRVFDNDKDGVLGKHDQAILAEFLEKTLGEWPLPDTQGKKSVLNLLSKSSDKTTISKDLWHKHAPELKIVENLLITNTSLLGKLYSVVVLPSALSWLNANWTRYQFDDVEHLMFTGDIILYHGNAAFSRTIELTTRSFFSHSGMIVRNPSAHLRKLYKCDPNIDLFIYDSDLSSLDGRAGGGVQLAPLRAWLQLCAGPDGASDGLVVVRRLHLPNRDGCCDWVEAPDCTFPQLPAFMSTVVGRAYETSRLQLIGAIAASSKEDLSTFFCSELVSASLKAMGLLPEAFVPSQCSPSRFSSKETSKPDSFCQFQRGAYYDREVQIFLYPPKTSEQLKHTLETAKPVDPAAAAAAAKVPAPELPPKKA